MSRQIDYQGIARILREFRLRHRVNRHRLSVASDILEGGYLRWSHADMKIAIAGYFAEIKRLADHR